jgi:hypothetical protein
MRPASWINVILGAWLIVAAWVLGYTTAAARAEDVVLGIAVVLVSLWAANSVATAVGAFWTLIVFAVWIFIAPWVLGYSAFGNALANDIVVAILIAIFSIVGLAQAHAIGPRSGGTLPPANLA